MGFGGLSLLNETEIKIYEANMESLAATNTSMTNVQVKITNQEITAIDNRRRLEEQNWTEILTVTYNLTSVYDNILK